MEIAPGTDIAAGSFLWTIPLHLPTSPAYRIKITSLTDTAIFDESETFTITHTPTTLTLTAPAAGAGWNTGTSNYITWTSTGTPGSGADLVLYRDDSLVRDIVLNTSIASGRFSWSIPWSLPTSSSYRIKITGTSDTSLNDYSDYFTITHTAAVTVTTPSAGTAWNAGSSHYIYWSSLTSTPGSYVSLYLCDSIQTIAIVSGISRANGYYYWSIPFSTKENSAYRIKIVSTTDTTAYGYSGFFTIHSQPNLITLTSPVSGVTWTAGQYYTIYWTYSGPDLAGTDVKIDLYDSTTMVETIQPGAAIGNLSFFWQVPSSLPTGSGYRMRIEDLALDTVFDFSDYFTISNPALIGDAYEPDSSYLLAKPIVRNDLPQSRTLSDDYDEDWIKFDAVSGTTYTIETQGSTDTYIDLFGTNGTSLLLSDDDSGDGFNAKIVWTCPASGTYYFVVAGWDVGSYTVTLR